MTIIKYFGKSDALRRLWKLSMNSSIAFALCVGNGRCEPGLVSRETGKVPFAQVYFGGYRVYLWVIWGWQLRVSL